MRVYPFFDSDLIKKAVTHPKVWPSVSDDYCKVDEFKPMDDGIYLAVEMDDYAGCFWLHPENSTTWQIHTCLLPIAWGKSQEAANMATQWMFDNTPCRKIITFVPQGNILAFRLAKRCGFEVEGVVKKSILKSGVLVDQTLLGLSGEPTCL